MKTRTSRDRLVRSAGRSRKGVVACPACGQPCASWRGVGVHLTLDRNDGTGGPVCEGARAEVRWNSGGPVGINLLGVRQKKSSRGRGRPCLPLGLRLQRLEDRFKRASRQRSYWSQELRRSRSALDAARRSRPDGRAGERVLPSEGAAQEAP